MAAGNYIGTNKKTAIDACCICGGGKRQNELVAYERTHSDCGPGIHCDYQHGGRCQCPLGRFGAGCAATTSSVSLAKRQFELQEPTSSSSTELATFLQIPLRRTVSDVTPTAISLRAAGDATLHAVDYQLLPPFDNVTWTGGTHGFITAKIKLFHDEMYKKAETFALKLQPHPTLYQDCTLVGPLAFNITILDGSPGVAQFDQEAYNVSESDSLSTVVLQRVGGSVGRMQILIKVIKEASNALPEEDYSFDSAKVTWEDGDDTPKAIVIPLLPDSKYETPDERLVLTIASTTHEDMRGTDNQVCELTILDDGDAGSLIFEHASYTISNGEERDVVIMVERQNGDSSAVNVVVRLSRDAEQLSRKFEVATADNFAFNEQTLSWLDGDSSPKAVAVSIFGNNEPKDLAFILELVDVGGGARILSPSATTVTLKGRGGLSDTEIVGLASGVASILTIALYSVYRIRQRSSAKIARMETHAKNIKKEADVRIEQVQREKDDLETKLNTAQTLVEKIMEEGSKLEDIYHLEYSDIDFGGSSEEERFGTVYKAKLSDDREVAVKTMHVTKITKSELNAFKGELLIMAPLHHPNLINLLGGCWSDGPDKLCIVLEYCSNGSLEELLKTGNKNEHTWSDPYYNIIVGIAACFQYLHHELPGGKPLIHRDLKPANVFIAEDMTAKVGDFGASRRFQTNTKSTKNMEMSMTMIGTPMFCAPEVLRHEKYGIKVDVYSFGVTLAVVSCVAVRGDWNELRAQFSARLAKVKNGWRPKLPQEIEAVRDVALLITQCWDEDSQARPTFKTVFKRLEIIGKEELAERASCGLDSTNYRDGRNADCEEINSITIDRRVFEHLKMVKKVLEMVSTKNGDLVEKCREIVQRQHA